MPDGSHQPPASLDPDGVPRPAVDSLITRELIDRFGRLSTADGPPSVGGSETDGQCCEQGPDGGDEGTGCLVDESQESPDEQPAGQGEDFGDASSGACASGEGTGSSSGSESDCSRSTDGEGGAGGDGGTPSTDGLENLYHRTSAHQPVHQPFPSHWYQARANDPQVYPGLPVAAHQGLRYQGMGQLPQPWACQLGGAPALGYQGNRAIPFGLYYHPLHHAYTQAMGYPTHPLGTAMPYSSTWTMYPWYGCRYEATAAACTSNRHGGSAPRSVWTRRGRRRQRGEGRVRSSRGLGRNQSHAATHAPASQAPRGGEGHQPGPCTEEPVGDASPCEEGTGRDRISACKEEATKDWLEGRWANMTDEVMTLVFAALGTKDIQTCRAVCHGWHDAVDQSMVELSPTWLKSKHFLLRFPYLRKVDLAKCQNVRNRDLTIVTEGTKDLRQLEMGSASNPPWVTNRGLEKLQVAASLTALYLNDCTSITNNGLRALNGLVNLSTLSLKGCLKITSKGIQALMRNTSLTSLNLYGCCRVGDMAMYWLAELPQLLNLSLGSTRVRDEGLHYIGCSPSLRELFVYGEDVNDCGVRELTGLRTLEKLTLRETFNLRGEGVADLVQRVTGLRYLDLCNSDMDDEQFIISLYEWSCLQALDMRGCYISEHALHELTMLTSLKSLCFEPFWDLPVPEGQNFCFSDFTTLTHLGLVGDAVTCEMIQAVRRLPLLNELSIADHVFSENMAVRQPLDDLVVGELATLTALTSLDVSRQRLTRDQVILLVDNLPKLREICVYDCQVRMADAAALGEQYPHIEFHLDIMKDGLLELEEAPGFIWPGQPGDM